MAVVLVVEDDAAVRSIVVRALERAGHRVLQDAGYKPAADLQFGDVDVLLCDIGLPGPSGYQIADACKAANRDCQVVFISGHSPEELERRGVPADTVILQKPVSVTELTRAVQDAARRRAWRELRTD
jgi:two-component system cell cycle sensor histidine kinase/response regulator CckA